jgi:hypothetical protein
MSKQRPVKDSKNNSRNVCKMLDRHEENNNPYETTRFLDALASVFNTGAHCTAIANQEAGYYIMSNENEDSNTVVLKRNIVKAIMQCSDVQRDEKLLFSYIIFNNDICRILTAILEELSRKTNIPDEINTSLDNLRSQVRTISKDILVEVKSLEKIGLAEGVLKSRFDEIYNQYSTNMLTTYYECLRYDWAKINLPDESTQIKEIKKVLIENLIRPLQDTRKVLSIIEKPYINDVNDDPTKNSEIEHAEAKLIIFLSGLKKEPISTTKAKIYIGQSKLSCCVCDGIVPYNFCREELKAV